MARSTATVAWLCITPGEHTYWLVDAALQAGLHVLAEKPWPCTRAQSLTLAESAEKNKLLIGIHYEYCLLEGVERWRADLHGGTGRLFRGRFNVHHRNRLEIPALDNLGSHLLAVHAYAVPDARLGNIECDYESIDERRVWLQRDHELEASLDFSHNREPIIQRFMARFEAGLDGSSFPFDVRFALRVLDSLTELKNRYQGDATR